MAALQADLASVSTELSNFHLTYLWESYRSTVLNLARSLVRDLPYGTVYLFVFNPNSTSSSLYIGTSLTRTSIPGSFVPETFTISGITRSYTFGYSVSNSYLLGTRLTLTEYTEPSSFTYNRSGSLNTVVCYGSLPEMPHLIEEEDSYEIQALFVLALGGCLFYFMSRIRNRLRL